MPDQGIECRWCGKTHKAEHCYQVREIEYFEDGRTPRRVVFENGQGQESNLPDASTIKNAIQEGISQALRKDIQI